MQALQNCALLSSATHAMDQLHDLLRQRREAHIRQTRQRGVVQADGASEPECPGVTPTGSGDFESLVRADCPLHSAPLHQRDDRGLQQQDQADPADGIWSTQCTQEAKAHFSLVWSALALGLNDGEEPNRKVASIQYDSGLLDVTRHGPYVHNEPIDHDHPGQGIALHFAGTVPSRVHLAHA